jgi:exodeoxyribonuclease VII small subunit
MGKKDLSFEQLFADLEGTVQKLEAGNLTLDESLALYERGMQLARTCNERLDRAELRLRELAPALDGGLETDVADALEDEEEGG